MWEMWMIYFKKNEENKGAKMKTFTSKELRQKWIKFYEDRGHKNIGAVSLIGDGTTGVMFNVAGMQPLMPYLLGKKHPDGTRLCNVQGCVRTVDIEEVGDASHSTFFEMMGNWSLGDYFKKDKTKWTFDFLTKELGLDKEKLCSTVFAGNQSAPKDTETSELLKEVGIKEQNIFYLVDNWWELDGTVNTPCGPDNEWFYPRHDKKCSDNCDATCECGRYVEIGNDVYMQYKKTQYGYEPLDNKNVDTGFGFERLLMFLNGLTDVYKTDVFVDAIEYIESVSGMTYGEDEKTTKSMRIIADHIRTGVMLIGDRNSLVPSNVGAGYILRRLLRRAIRHCRDLAFDSRELQNIAKIYIENVYVDAYPLLKEKELFILDELNKEIEKFEKTLEQGLKEFDKVLNAMQRKNDFMKSQNPEYNQENLIGGKQAFRLYDTFGFPLELTIELAQEKGFDVDVQGYNDCFKEHQEKSKAVEKGEFKSGLNEQNEMTTKYHTATHLLNSALKLVIGEKSHQMGSNITSERLRFDFPCDHKMTQEELDKVQEIVNGWIKQELQVSCEVMPKQKAVEIGAEHQFIEKYPDIVTVYSIGDISKEICTGPHVKNTNELGHFKITKEEASSSGVRRIKAILD